MSSAITVASAVLPEGSGGSVETAAGCVEVGVEVGAGARVRVGATAAGSGATGFGEGGRVACGCGKDGAGSVFFLGLPLF